MKEARKTIITNLAIILGWAYLVNSGTSIINLLSNRVLEMKVRDTSRRIKKPSGKIEPVSDGLVTFAPFQLDFKKLVPVLFRDPRLKGIFDFWKNYVGKSPFPFHSKEFFLIAKIPLPVI